MVITTTLPQFEPTHFWTRTADGFHIQRKYADADVIKTVTDVELNQIHPDLAVSFCLYHAQALVVGGFHINQTIRALFGTAFVTGINGIEVLLENVGGIKITNKYVRFTARGMKITRMPHPNNSSVCLPIPCGNVKSDITVDRAWLDTHYPNWKARWEVAHDLDLSFEESIAQIFNVPQPACSVVLPQLDTTTPQ